MWGHTHTVRIYPLTKGKDLSSSHLEVRVYIKEKVFPSFSISLSEMNLLRRGKLDKGQREKSQLSNHGLFKALSILLLLLLAYIVRSWMVILTMLASLIKVVYRVCIKLARSVH